MKSLEDHIKNKNYVAGVRQVNRCLTENHIQKVYLAEDADEQFKQSVLKNANAAGVEVVTAGSGKTFAALCGIKVNCAVIGILRQN